MKKIITGLIFLAAVCLATAGTYTVVMAAEVDFKIKLVFSGVILLLALIVGIYASAVTRDSKRKAIETALCGIKGKGIAIYEDGEFVFANDKYIRTEEKENVNFFKAVRDGKTVDGYDVKTEENVNGKSRFFIIEVEQTVTVEESVEPQSETENE